MNRSQLQLPETLLLFILLAFSLLLNPGHADAARTVRAGIYNFKPLVYTAPDGSPGGIYVEMLNDIAAQEHWDVQYVPGTWQEGMERLKSDQIDLLLCIGYTEEREKYLDFPKEFLLMDWGLVYKSKRSSINTIMDLDGKTVAMLKGSIYSARFLELVSQFNIHVNIVEKSQVSEVFKAVEAGQVEAGVTSNLPGMLNEPGFDVERTSVIFAPIKLGYGVNKGRNGDLVASLDRHIATMKADRSSRYYHQLEQLTGKKDAKLSKTMYAVLTAGAAALLLAISFVIVLRREVRRKTEELRISNHELTVQAGRLASIIDGTTDAVFIKDAKGRYTVVNEEVVRLFDMPRSEIIGRDDTAFFSIEEAGYLMAGDKAIMDGDRVVTKEEIVTTLGRKRIYLATKGPVHDEQGRVTGLFGISRDITDLKQSEDKLKNLSQRLLLATSSAHLGVWDWNVRDNTMTWDDRMFELYGNPPATSPNDIDAWKSRLHPEDRERTIAECLAALHEQTEFHSVFRVLHPDGTVKHIKANALVIRGADGTAERMLGTNQDITEQKLAEESLRHVSERLLLATGAGGVGIWEWDVINDHLIWDDQMFSLYGVTSDRFASAYEAWRAGVHPDDLTHTEAALQTSLADQKDFDSEFRVIWPDGSLHHLKALAQLHRDSSGKPTSISGITYDITERKFKESVQQQTEYLLELTDAPADLHGCMSALTASLQSWSGCEAVGIRLRSGEDYPYFESRGFPLNFIEAENRLCAYGPDGKIVLDSEGNPLLECMCGSVLCGQFDSTASCVTPRGSFWSNNTTDLVTRTGESRLRSRDRCSGEGYQSVALIPLKAGNRIVGMLQFNDHRPNRFTPAIIDSLEGIAEKLAFTLQRREAEKELHQSEQLFRTLVNTIPDLIWLKDVNGVYISCNTTFERFFGAKEADIKGKTDYDFVDKELADFFRQHDRAAMLKDNPSSNEESITFADDGHRASLYTTKMPMYDSEGKIIGILGIGRDITELKRAEEAMRESENRLRHALEGTNDGLWDVQFQTGKTYLSPRGCQILGYAEDEMSDRIDVWSDLVHPDDMHITRERLQAHLDGKTAFFEVEQRLRTKSGDWKWIHTRGKVVERDAGGVALRITGTHSDITEKKILESQLYQAQKMESVGCLAGGVAHDFNNKLSVILGHTYLALTAPDTTQLHDSLEEIRKAAEQSAELTSQLLAFARKQTIAPRTMDLNETVTGLLKMLQRLIGEDIHLTWHPASNLWLILFDPSQLDQILANLCVNARDSIADSGTIIIESGNSTIDEEFCAKHADALPGEYVRLVVSDNGCGMDRETLKRIFEPFFTTKETGKGTGLGLATVFGIVKQNNGFINVHSEPGLGTTFTIYLPRYLGKSQLSQDKVPAMPALGGLETILLVEDEYAILDIATIILTRQGYRVLPANNPAEAIRLAKEHVGEVDLLVTDVIMPGMNGKNLALDLRSLNPQLKCLFMSGYTADTIAQHGVLDEGVNFIQKPFSLPVFAAKVREVLDSE